MNIQMTASATQRALTTLIAEWNRAGVRWVVLGRLPSEEETGGDVDIALAHNDRKRAISLLSEVIDRERWRLVQVMQHEVTAWYAVVAIPSEYGWEFLKLDLCTDYRIGGRLLMRADELIESSVLEGGLWSRPAADANAQYYLFKSLAKGRFDRKTIDFIKGQATSQRGLGSGRLIEDEQRQLDAWLEAESTPSSNAVRSVYRSLALRRPKAHLREWLRIAHRLRYPCGFHLVLTGPDGVGKSTVAQSLIAQLNDCFRGVSKVHLFTVLSDEADQPKTPIKPYQKGGLGWIGSMAKLVLIAARSHRLFWSFIMRRRGQSFLVLNDRHVIDALADPKRFRLSLSPAVVRLLHYVTPSPDLILCLEAEPQTIQARKAEVSVSETADQLARYRDVVKSTRHAHLIDANGSPDEVAMRLTEHCLDGLAKRQVRRGWRL